MQDAKLKNIQYFKKVKCYNNNQDVPCEHQRCTLKSKRKTALKLVHRPSPLCPLSAVLSPCPLPLSPWCFRWAGPVPAPSLCLPVGSCLPASVRAAVSPLRSALHHGCQASCYSVFTRARFTPVQTRSEETQRLWKHQRVGNIRKSRLLTFGVKRRGG